MMNEKPLTAVIVDDEPLALEGLRLRLEKIPELEVIGEACDGDEAIKLCQQLTPNVLFLDLQMPGLNGIEVVQALQADILPMVVFVSAYGEYAIDAFELNAIDYLLKPANLGRLQKTVARLVEKRGSANKAKYSSEKHKLLHALGQSSGLAIAELEEWLGSEQRLPSTYCQKLVIKNSDNEKVFVPVTDIRWIDAAGDYMCVHTDKETHIVRVTMKKLANQLDERLFKRIHKSTLVNVNYIQSIRALRNSESVLTLAEDVQLKVSRNFSDAIQAFVKSKLP